MLIFKLTDDRQYFQLINYDTKGELKDLQMYFKKRQQGYHFNRLYKRKLWDGFDHFIDKDLRIGVGLWKEILKFGTKLDYEIHIENLDDLLSLKFPKDKFEKFSSVLLDGADVQDREYQLEAAYRALKYKFCVEELATSAGKTMVFFTYLAFLKRKGIVNTTTKALLIVPKISLVNQTALKFQNDYNTGLIEFNILQMGGTNKFSDKKLAEADLVISTYQTLGNKDSEFFKQFSVLCIDEAHTSRGNTIKDILLASTNVQYKLGLSGTIKIEEEYSDFFKIQEFIGPLVMTLPASYLIENNYSPDVYVKMVYLDYPNDEPFVKQYKQLREDGKSGKLLYDLEKEFIISYDKRIAFISSFVKKLGGNTLVLFINVKDQYGQRICDKISEWNPNAYYIDGGVKGSHRDDYTEIMEKPNDSTIIELSDRFITVHQLDKVELTNGSIKRAIDLIDTDEISDDWINRNSKKRI